MILSSRSHLLSSLIIITVASCITLIDSTSVTSDYSSLSATCNSTYPGKCLIYEQEKEFSLHDAQSYCAKFNFTILKVESMRENNLIRKLVSPTAGAWITANALSDGSSRALRFHPRCKTQCCGIYISSDGYWREDTCDRTHGIICQRKGVEEFPLLADLLEQMAYEQRILQKETPKKGKDLNSAASGESATSSEARQGKSIAVDSAEEPFESLRSAPPPDEEDESRSVVTDESIVRVHTVIGSVTQASEAPIIISSNNGAIDVNRQKERKDRPPTALEDHDERGEEEETSDKEKDEYDYDNKASSIAQDFPSTTEASHSSYDTEDKADEYLSSESPLSSSASNDNASSDRVARSSLSTSIKVMMLLLGTFAVVTLVILSMHLIMIKSRSASYEVPPEAGLISRDYTKW